MLKFRIRIVNICIIIFTFLLFLKLFVVQIVQEDYKIYAEKNSIRVVTKYSSRGVIFDRNNNILVENVPFYDLNADFQIIGVFDTLKLSGLLDIQKRELKENIKKYKHNRIGNIISIEKQISTETYAKLQEKLFDFQGFFTNTRISRYYPDSIAPLLLGYISEIGREQIDQGYAFGDYLGVTGVEKYYDKYLRGDNGSNFFMVDSRNRIQGRYRNGAMDKVSVAGKNLVLSIDKDLQRFGEQLMKNKIGSVVAIEPVTGDILCFVSSPSYDPNGLVGRRRNKFSQLVRDPFKPMLNRPIQAQYPPGSTFKLITALYALEKGLIDPSTSNTCIGFYSYGRGRILRCTHIHGNVDMYTAIAESCNVYFCFVFDLMFNNEIYDTPQEVYDDWYKFVTSMGIGSRLNVDMDFEADGYFPNSSYYDKLYGKSWNAHTIISMAIGQGEVLLTPLQMANVMAIFANKMTYFTPHTLKSQDSQKELITPFVKRTEIDVNNQNLDYVIEGMSRAVNQPSGTAYWHKIDGIEMVGKTGTAENPHGDDHSVFVAFAPRKNPQIAIAVVVENAGYGSTWAAPIASFMVEKYLKGKVEKHPWFLDRISSANLMTRTQN